MVKKASTSEGSIPAALPLMASTWAGSHSLRSTLSGTSSQSLRKSVTALRLRLYPNSMDAGTQRRRERERVVSEEGGEKASSVG